MAEAERGSGVASAVRRVPQWVGELALIAVFYVAYEFGRGLHQGTQKAANHTAHTLLRWEQAIDLDPEKWLTVSLDKITALAVPASYFYATFHYIITPAVLIWLYRSHHKAYGPARTWLATSTLIGLVIFYLVPTTPPRLLNLGYPDVLDDVKQYGWWGSAGSAPRGLGHLTNQLAAMPSMHFGWALFCGVMIFRHAARRWVRALGVLYPLLTGIVVLSTGNHYLLDLVGGALVMAAGWGVTVLFRRFGQCLYTVLVRRHEERQRADAQFGAAPASTTGTPFAPDDRMRQENRIPPGDRIPRSVPPACAVDGDGSGPSALARADLCDRSVD